MSREGSDTRDNGDQELLSAEEIADMKHQLSTASVMSLADSASNFGEHVGDEEGSENGEEVVVDKHGEEVSQGRVVGGYMFDRSRPANPKLPETVAVLNGNVIPNLPRPFINSVEEWERILKGAELYLVGTAHFSKESMEDVRKVIEAVQPDLVMVELCPSRAAMLTLDEETLLREAKELSTAKIIQLIRNGGPISGILYVLLVSMSAHVTRELSMAPGGEFRTAFKSAKEVPVCKFILGDRPIEVTIGRALGNLSVWQKIKFFFSLLTSHSMKITPEDVEQCKQQDVLEQLLAEMAGSYPGLSEIFVDERDRYMSFTLQKLCIEHTLNKYLAWQHTDGVEWQPIRVVSVVGIGHKPGIQAHWGAAQNIDALMFIPPPTFSQKAVTFTLKWSIYGLTAYGIYRATRCIGRRLGRF